MTNQPITSQAITSFGARAVRFGISGGLSTLVAYLTFIAALKFWHYAAATVISWCLSVGFSFVVNRRFTFGIKGRQDRGRDFVLFVIGSLIQLALALIGYRILLGAMHLRPTVAFLINLAFTSSFSFAYLSLVGFRRTNAKPAEANPLLEEAP
jgi:putative flippase GtrA